MSWSSGSPPWKAARAAALAVASGTSAIFYTVINLCQAGDEIVSANNLYGGTYTQFNNILPQFGITVHFVDPRDPANFAAAITDKTKRCSARPSAIRGWTSPTSRPSPISPTTTACR